MAKVLVVEDESEIRELIVEELNDIGHTTVEAGNGLQGLEKLAVDRPDLILSDITMPDMNGYQFFRSVREHHPEHAQTPFIFLTALSDREDELKGFRLGVDDYVTKPIDFDLLVARVELGLRRHQAPAAVTPLPAKSPADVDRSLETKAAEVSEIVVGDDGRVLAGKFETISLEAIRAKVGDRWSEISDQILNCAKAVIEENLGPSDALNITVAQDFLVCFADLTDEQVDSKVSVMRDAIWDRLFGETGDEGLSQVTAQAYDLALELDDASDVDVIFAKIDDQIERKKVAASDANQKRLLQIYKYEDLFALTLLNSNGTPSNIKLLSFESRFVDLIRKLFDARLYGRRFLLDLQQLLFERLREKRNLCAAFSRMAMLLPIHFAILDDPEARAQLIALCDDLRKSLDLDLVIEIIESPDRVKSHMNALTALPGGRKVQFLELRRIAQIDGIALGELQELGITFISMRYGNVIQHKEQTLQPYIKMLEKGGTKFCIKDIPEGKLFDAQTRKAHLYAMQH